MCRHGRKSVKPPVLRFEEYDLSINIDQERMSLRAILHKGDALDQLCYDSTSHEEECIYWHRVIELEDCCGEKMICVDRPCGSGDTVHFELEDHEFALQLIEK